MTHAGEDGEAEGRDGVEPIGPAELVEQAFGHRRMIPRLQGKEQPSAADVALRGGEGRNGDAGRPRRGSGGEAARGPARVTPAYIERAALAYLARFASSAENLRRVLRRKVERRCRARDEDAAPFLALVDEVVARTVRG